MEVYLTIRQMQVLELISKELTSIEIGKKLGLSKGTVEVHKKALFEKFNVRSKVGLVMQGFIHEIFVVNKSGPQNFVQYKWEDSEIKLINNI